MAKTYKIYLWKKAPFLRLVLPIIAGILIEFYARFGIVPLAISAVLLITSYIIFTSLPLAWHFTFNPVRGAIITLFMINLGAFITWNKDARNHAAWYGNRYDTGSYLVAIIRESPVEKNKSYKALAGVEAIIKNGSAYRATGKLLLYFAKDDSTAPVTYGNRILIKKELQEIKNSGNPGEFNYARYCAFRQIFYQCFLTKRDWVVLQGKNTSLYQESIFRTRHFVLEVLNRYIPGKDESALAKALLIGYKVDMDKDLVQAYSNAGVVHLIAISGLHLALIYAILLWITNKIPFIRKSKWMRLVLLLFCLWFFSLITGAAPSVMRSAVMFSFIAAGMTIKKNAFIYNSLAASAFILLCADPFLLWNVGFQLSYCAVLGIVITQRNISNWFYFHNRLLRITWQLASVSLSAQLFTFPLCLYYFHQMPLLFLASNLIAIPLATLTLWGCLALVFISPFHMAAAWLGKAIMLTIGLLNQSVLYVNALPFSLWEGISISAAGVIVWYFFIALFLYWLLQKNNMALKLGLSAAMVLAGVGAIEKWMVAKQRKIIVYNVTAHQAIDFVNGKNFRFVGDSELNKGGLLQDFHIKPCRLAFGLQKNREDAVPLVYKNDLYRFFGKRILLIDSARVFNNPAKKIHVDYVIISKNPKLYMRRLAAVFDANLYVFDGSNPMWKIDKWKKDCEELHLRFYSVPEQGAFVKDL